MIIPRVRYVRAAVGVFLLFAALADPAAAAQSRWEGALRDKIDRETSTFGFKGRRIKLFTYRGNPGDQIIVTIEELETRTDGRKDTRFPAGLRLLYAEESGGKSTWKDGIDDVNVKGFRLKLAKTEQQFAVVGVDEKAAREFRIAFEIDSTAPEPLVMRWESLHEQRLQANHLNYNDVSVDRRRIYEFEVTSYDHVPTFRVKEGERDLPFTTLISQAGHGKIRVTFPRAGTYRFFTGGFRDGEFTTNKLYVWSSVTLEKN